MLTLPVVYGLFAILITILVRLIDLIVKAWCVPLVFFVDLRGLLDVVGAVKGDEQLSTLAAVAQLQRVDC